MSYFDEFDPTPDEEYLEDVMEEIEILMKQKKKLIEALRHYVTGEHYKMRSNGRLVTPEIAETVLKEVGANL